MDSSMISERMMRESNYIWTTKALFSLMNIDHDHPSHPYAPKDVENMESRRAR